MRVGFGDTLRLGLYFLLPAFIEATLWGTTGGFNGASSYLYEIDPTTGRGTEIGQITLKGSPVSINGLAFDASDPLTGGTLYGHVDSYTPDPENTGSRIVTIDTGSGLATEVGPDFMTRLGGLAIDMFGQPYSWLIGSSMFSLQYDLVKIDKDTGRGLVFGDARIPTPGNFAIDFDRSDHLMLFHVTSLGEVYEVSTANGLATSRGRIGDGSFRTGYGSMNPNVNYNEMWLTERAFDGFGNINSRIRVVSIDNLSVVRDIQTNVDHLQTLAWGFKTTQAPSSNPTSAPSAAPSTPPTGRPSATPTRQPSASPSSMPTSKPSAMPSYAPTGKPSAMPSAVPSSQPSQMPSGKPSAMPSSAPSGSPSSSPSAIPSAMPSVAPSSQPSQMPTGRPSQMPSRERSASPSTSVQPSAMPSQAPSRTPTVPDPCVTNTCDGLFGTNNEVHADVLGVCFPICVPSVIADIAVFFGWSCGGC